MDKTATVIAAIIAGLGGFLLLSFLLSWPVWMLWNGCLVGAISGVNEITWMQAWGISVLFGFLFKNTVNVNNN
jgi:hypothetical protein